MKSLVEIENLSYSYKDSNQRSVEVLKGISISFKAGEFVAITGPSGSGKTTLVNILGLLTDFEKGRFLLNGISVRRAATREKERLRADLIGFIFQDYILLEHMTILENVLLPLQYSKISRRDKLKRADKILDQLGIREFKNRRPNQLSGGQKQRAAIARAIIKAPKLIIADEPASALDPANRLEVLRCLQQLSHSGTTVLMVTHSAEDARVASRCVSIQDGQIRLDSLTKDRRILTQRNVPGIAHQKDFISLALGFLSAPDLDQRVRYNLKSLLESETLSILHESILLSASLSSEVERSWYELDWKHRETLIEELSRRRLLSHNNWKFLLPHLTLEELKQLSEATLTDLLSESENCEKLERHLKDLIEFDSAQICSAILSSFKVSRALASRHSKLILRLILDPSARVRTDAIEVAADIGLKRANNQIFDAWETLSAREWGVLLSSYLRSTQDPAWQTLNPILKTIFGGDDPNRIKATFFGLSSLPNDVVLEYLVLASANGAQSLMPELITVIQRARDNRKISI